MTPRFLLRAYLALTLLLAADHRAGDSGRVRTDDRGDVPGWVLITMMTAALVVALWALAGEAFTSMFEDAMNRVRSAG